MLRILLFLLLMVSSVAHATTILIVGDSLSAGYRMSADQAWPQQLAKHWPAITVVNASVSGDTTQGGLQRLPTLLTQHQPDLVLLELGGNDGLRGLAPQLIANNLAKMIRLAKDANAQVILTDIQLPPNYGRRYLDKFEAIFSELATTHQLPLMPFFVAPLIDKEGMMMNDGIHPTAKAQPEIVKQVHAFLTPYVDALAQ
ncbi:arylesterase [Oceanisphaera avium]|uniref:Arylesterase n=1 Tax=Oceanisphaera avium TaxID=1903694 RepID=A0A1Y0CX70_9GAMM|nr:arylesterase [Oceanisphaera avium]ART79912.1 arylesterase [Oceanisphaera avium]